MFLYLSGIVSGSLFQNALNPAGQVFRYSLSSLKESPELFSDLVRKGDPFIISSFSEDWPVESFKGWDCVDFAGNFSDANVRVEYTGGHRGSLADVLNDQNTSNFWEGFEGLRSPVVWHVKDEASDIQKSTFLKKFPGLPHLLSPLMNAHLRDSAELWLQREGSGALVHADGYCSGVLSFQLKGSKEWRLMRPPDYFSDLSTHFFDDTDGGLYKCGAARSEPPRMNRFNNDTISGCVPFKREWVVKLGEDEALYFPPGILHETESESDCTVSVTALLRSPMPVKWIRNFLPSISLVGDAHRCVRQWQNFARPKFSSNGDADFFELADSNFNDFLEFEEILNFFKKSPKKSSLWRLGFTNMEFSYDQDIANEITNSMAWDAFFFWDEDEDGQVSRAEITSTFKRFSANEVRSKLVTNILDTWNRTNGVDEIRASLKNVEDSVQSFMQIV